MAEPRGSPIWSCNAAGAGSGEAAMVSAAGVSRARSTSMLAMLASSTRVLSARLASRTCSASGSAARSACRHARTSRSTCAAVAQQATATSRASVAGVATRVSAHQGVGKPAAGHGRGEVVEIGLRGGDAQLFAGRAEIEAGAPVEPVGTGTEALPAVVAIELAQLAQELVGGDLDARGQLGNLVAEAIQVGRLGGSGSVVSLARCGTAGRRSSGVA